MFRANGPRHKCKIFVVVIFIRNQLVLIHLFLHASHVTITFKRLLTLYLRVKLLLVQQPCFILLLSLVRIILIVE